MRVFLLYIFLLLATTFSFAQGSSRVEVLADSAAFLIHENYRLDDAWQYNVEAEKGYKYNHRIPPRSFSLPNQ